MPRPQRIDYPNAWYHVMNRGKARQRIFHSAEFYQAFLGTLAEAHQRFGLEIHAYCLMSNHYHLLVKTPRGNLSRCMRHVNGVYTQRYNGLKRIDGPLFRGRFKAILVDHDTYLLALSRYIHRNPIETHSPLVNQLANYAWSSYPAYINHAQAPAWLIREAVYRQLNTPRPHARYRAYVELGNDEAIQAFYGKAQLAPVLGLEDFKEKVIRKKWHNVTRERLRKQMYELPTVSHIVKGVADLYEVKASAIYQSRRGDRNEARGVAMYLSQMLGDHSLSETAEHFGLGHVSSVSQRVKRLKLEMQEDRVLRKRVNMLCQYLTP